MNDKRIELFKLLKPFVKKHKEKKTAFQTRMWKV